MLRRPSGGQNADGITDFSVAEGDRFLALRDQFPGASASDFDLLGGTLLYRGETIALVSRDGQPLNWVDDLASILKIVDTASAVNQDSATGQEPNPSQGKVEPPLPPPTPGPSESSMGAIEPLPSLASGLVGGDPGGPALQLTPSGSGVELATGSDSPKAALVQLKAIGRHAWRGKSLSFMVGRRSDSGLEKRRRGLLSSGRTKTVELLQGEELLFGLRRRNGSIKWLTPESFQDDPTGMVLCFKTGGGQRLDVQLQVIEL